jgi:hypothetical protein
MAPRSSPRTVGQLASMDVTTRSDYAAWCQGLSNVCDQMSLIIGSLQDELYRRLVLAGGGGYSARLKARHAVRPLGWLAASIATMGHQAPRAFRHYAKVYAVEINPEAKKPAAKFDHKA